MNETIADIIAEKREMADALESATSRDRTAEQQETIDDLRTDADRVEAAWKRERDRLMSEPRSWEECVERAMKAKENSDEPY